MRPGLEEDALAVTIKDVEVIDGHLDRVERVERVERVGGGGGVSGEWRAGEGERGELGG